MSTATANDIINRAGRRLNILAGEEEWTGAEAADNLQLLNDMMHGFNGKGIQYAHVDLAAADTVNMPDELIRPLILVFCKELAIDYGEQIDPMTMGEITDAENQLKNYYLSIPPSATDRGLIRRVNNIGPFSITRGY
jgi:hypothetical protein